MLTHTHPTLCWMGESKPPGSSVTSPRLQIQEVLEPGFKAGQFGPSVWVSGHSVDNLCVPIIELHRTTTYVNSTRVL